MDFLKRYKHRTQSDLTPQEYDKQLQEKDFEYYLQYASNRYLAHKWNENKQFALTIQDVSWSNVYGDEKYFNVLNTTELKIGDVIKIDKFCDRLWLIIEQTYKSVKSHKNFKARPCTYILKCLLPSQKNIIETPCVIDNATKYSTGVEETHKVPIGNARRSIWLPRNIYTEQLTHDMRLFTRNDVWSITALDYDTNPNLIILTCTEDAFNPLTDNKALRVANYYCNNEINQDVKNKTEEKIIIGKNELKLQTYQTYSTSQEFKNIEWKSNNRKVHVMDKHRKQCTLYVDDRDELYKKFKLQLYNDEKLINEKEIKIINVI